MGGYSWFVDLVAEAEKIPRNMPATDGIPDYYITGHLGRYGIGKLIGESEEFKLYRCVLAGGEQGILKIAMQAKYNGVLDREAAILENFKQEALHVEEEYARVKQDLNDDPVQMLNYHLCFPHLVESFLCPAQGNRRITILTFPALKDGFNTFVPMRHLRSREHVRVDRKTSAWMMGKFLKFLTFAHSLDISINHVTGSNILIEKSEHYVMVFDLTSAIIYDGGVPEDIAREEIMRGAGEMIRALGGDPDFEELPDDEYDPDNRYGSHLYKLATGSAANAKQAHEDFYALVRDLWPRGYWPFTCFPIG